MIFRLLMLAQRHWFRLLSVDSCRSSFLLGAAHNGMARCPAELPVGIDNRSAVAAGNACLSGNGDARYHGMRRFGDPCVDPAQCNCADRAAAMDAPTPSQSCPGAPFQFTQDTQRPKIRTDKIEVSFGLERGNLTFRTVNGDSCCERETVSPAPMSRRR